MYLSTAGYNETALLELQPAKPIASECRVDNSNSEHRLGE